MNSKSSLSSPLLGFDYGCQRIGVAVGQALTASARPLKIIPAQHQQPDWKAIARLIDEWQPGLLIVGVPRHADNSASHTTAAALAFADELQQRFALPVATIDERLSSVEAAHRLAGSNNKHQKRRRNRSGFLDDVAAAVILESWFNQ